MQNSDIYYSDMQNNDIQNNDLQFSNAQFKNSKLICVTNRHLCEDDFLDRLRRIAFVGNAMNDSCSGEFGTAPPTMFGGIMLREKDLPFSEYEKLARKVKNICDEEGVDFIAHFFDGMDFVHRLHLPLHRLEELIRTESAEGSTNETSKSSSFSTNKSSYYKEVIQLGASCHSTEDAQLAESLGCSYITFGHVFETDCKKGLQPRGLSLLSEVIDSVSIPVYAIGGISPDNYDTVINAGAAGACIMSGLMQCKEPREYLGSYLT